MMFNAAYNRVVSRDLPEAVRFQSFLWCIEHYCWLTRQSFQATYLRLGRKYGFDWNQKPDERQLRRAAAYLKDDRTEFLVKLDEFIARRREAKGRGQRRPTKAELDDLYNGDWIPTC